MQTQRDLSQSSARSVSYDAGLRSYFQKIYNIMAFGLAVTGIVAFAVSQSPALLQVFFGNGIIRFAVIMAPLAMVWFGFSRTNLARLNFQQLTMMFIAYAAILGVSLSTIFLVYGEAAIGRAFFITSIAFLGTSIFAYVTKKDLSGLGSLCFMGFFGIFAASIVNYFLHSTPLQLAISVVSVLVFPGLIAWKTQYLKQMYNSGNSAELNNKLAVWGALQLHISFINLFLAVLRLSGSRR